MYTRFTSACALYFFHIFLAFLPVSFSGFAIAALPGGGGGGTPVYPPGNVTVPAYDSDGAFVVSWGAAAGASPYYLLQESKNSGAWTGVAGTNGLSYTVTGRGNGSYQYRVQNCGGSSSSDNCSGFKTSSTATVALKPGVPSSIASPSTDNDGTITVSWGASSGSISQYRLYRQVNGGSWVNLYNGTSRSKVVSGLNDGNYKFRVQACYTLNGYTSCSDYRTSGNTAVTFPPSVPGPITGPDADSDGIFTLSWSASTGSLSSYRLEQQKDGGAWGLIQASTSRTKAIAVTANGIYGYRVQACGAGGCSDYTAIKTVNVAIPLDPPSIPQWKTVPAESDFGDYDLAWQAATGTVDYYKLQERINAGAWLDVPLNTPLAYQARGKVEGEYDYRVQACNVEVCSSWSNAARIRVHNLQSIRPAVTIANADVPGTLDYSADVTATGDGVITVPLAVVPGVNGVAPDLSIDYSSGRPRQRIDEELPEDILGYGWRLGGFSAIRRCVKNRTDVDRVQLTSVDSLCLDGKPLVLISGTHWEPGAVYHTLRETYVRVELKGTVNAPWFQVRTSDGNTLEYGKTEASRVRLRNASRVSPYYHWSLNRATDAFGNPISYNYHKDELSGVNYPLSIQYGEVDNTGQADAGVTFYYMRRHDAVAMPLADIEQGQLVMLHTIEITLSNQKVREYRLASEKAPEGWRRLAQIQECGYDESGQSPMCLPALDFDWLAVSAQIPEDFKTGVERITDGLGAITEFQHEVMTQDGTEASFAERPFGDEIVPPDTTPLLPSADGALRCVVTELRRSNGLGGFHRTRYAYHGRGLMSTKNWGFLGYYAQRIRNETSGVVTYRQRRLDYPFFGSISALHQYDANYGAHSEVLTREETHYSSQVINHGNGETTIFPYVDKTIRYLFESGAELGAQESVTLYDFSSGQVSHIANIQRVARALTETAVGGNYWGDVPDYSLSNIVRTSASDLTFTNRTGSGLWLIGFADSLTVRHYRGDMTALLDRTETVSMTPFGNTNAVGSVVRFPDDSEYELTTTYDYDDHGNLINTTVEGVNVPRRTVSALNFIAGRYPTLLRNALNQDSHVGYDLRFGQAKHYTDPNGRVTQIVFDPFGREVSRTTPDNVQLTTHYDFCALVGCNNVGGIAPVLRVRTQSPITPTSTSYYGQLGRTLRTEVVAFDGTASIYRDYYYDQQGRLDRYSQPYFEADAAYFTQLSYDLRNRVSALERPDGGSVITTYQPDVAAGGVQVDVAEMILAADGTVADIQTKRSFYNILGELVSTSDDATGLAVTTTYSYEASGLPLTVKVDGGQAATFTYDVAGNRRSITGPNIGTISSRYTALGQLRWQQDNKGQVISYAYDLLGRLVSQTDAEGVASWHYDPLNAIGALESRSYGTGFTETYHYDSDSKLIRVVTQLEVSGYSKTYTHDYTYDGYGRIDTVTYPSGLEARYDYPSQGYLSSISNVATGTALQTFTEADAYGHIKLEEYGNGVKTQRDYDPKTGRLQSIGTSLGAMVLQDNTYVWRSNTTLESRLRTAGSNTTTEYFDYDTLNRLSAARTYLDGDPQRELRYAYSRLGNIATKTSNVAGDLNVTGYQYGTTSNAGPNAVSEVTLGATDYQLSYDPNGNLTHYDAAQGDDKFIVWNSRNLPVTITVGANSTTASPTARDQFQYGPDGQRYYKQSTYNDGGTLKTEHTFYVGDFEEIITDADPDVAAIRKSRVGGSLIHIQIHNRTGVVEESVEYLHRDHLGSVEAVTDESGSLLYMLAYDPFGGRRNSDWLSDIDQIETDTLLSELNITTSRGYTGHEHLDRTGFIHMNGRVYDPQLGRFLSPDPIVQAPANSQSWNRYSYVFNNPLSYVDPTGYETCDYYDEQLGNCDDEPITFGGWGGWIGDRDSGNDWRALKRMGARVFNAERRNSEALERFRGQVAGVVGANVENSGAGNNITGFLKGIGQAFLDDQAQALADGIGIQDTDSVQSSIQLPISDSELGGVGLAQSAVDNVGMLSAAVMMVANLRNGDATPSREMIMGSFSLLVKDGAIDASLLSTFLPSNLRNSFRPTDRVPAGQKYMFKIGDTKINIKWHSRDLGLKETIPRSNSARVWTAQIQVGRKFLMTNGQWTRKQKSNRTHIPIIR